MPPNKTNKSEKKAPLKEKNLPEIIDLKKINQEKTNKIKNLEKSEEPSPPKEFTFNPFIVKPLKEAEPKQETEKVNLPKTISPASFPNQRENLSLPLKEREKLRELWMNQKGIVRGRNLNTETRLDLINNQSKNKNIEKNELTTENQGLLQTTHRKVIGSGAIVDLRSNSPREKSDFSPTKEITRQPNPFPQKNRTVLLPLFNTKLFLAFLIFIFLTLGILAGVILPDAKLEIKPRNNSQDLEIKALVSGEVTQTDIDNKTIPGDPIRFKITTEGDYPTSGEKDSIEKSGGKVTITNNSGEPLSLKQNATLVDKNGQKFFLVSPTTIPAGELNNNSNSNSNSNENTNSTVSLKTFGSASVSIIAEKSEQSYVLKEGTELSLPGLADSSFKDAISVKVSKDFTAGTSKKINYLSAEDLQKAQKDLTEQAKQKALEEFQNKYGNIMGKLFSVDSLQTENTNFITDKKENEETENFHASLETDFFVLLFQENNLSEMAKNLIERNQDQKNGIATVKSYTPIGVNSLENKMEISAQINYGTSTQLNLEDIRKQIINKSQKEVTEYLNNNREIESYNLHIWPSWLPFMPILDKRIEIKIQ